MAASSSLFTKPSLLPKPISTVLTTVSTKTDTKEETKKSKVEAAPSSTPEDLITFFPALLEELGLTEHLARIALPMERELKRELKTSESPLLDLYIALQQLINIKKLFYFSHEITEAAFNFILNAPKGVSFQVRTQDVAIVALISKYNRSELKEENEEDSHTLLDFKNLETNIKKSLVYLDSSDKDMDVYDVQNDVNYWRRTGLLTNFENLAQLKNNYEHLDTISFILNCLQTAVHSLTQSEKEICFNEIMNIFSLGIRHIKLLAHLASVISNLSVSQKQFSDYLKALSELELNRIVFSGQEDFKRELSRDPYRDFHLSLHVLLDGIPDGKFSPKDRDCLSKTAVILEKNEFKTAKDRREFILNTAYFAAMEDLTFTFRFCLEQQNELGSPIFKSSTLENPFYHKSNSATNPYILNFLMLALKNNALSVAKQILLKMNGDYDTQEQKLTSWGGVEHFGHTALYYACSQGHFRFAEILLILGARSFGYDTVGFHYTALLLSKQPESEILQRIFKFFAQEPGFDSPFSSGKRPSIPTEEARAVLDVFCDVYKLPRLPKPIPKKTLKQKVACFFGSQSPEESALVVSEAPRKTMGS